MSITINLRDYYPWYTKDEFIAVSEEVAAELAKDRRYEKAYRERVRANKAYYSLDADDGIETSAVIHSTDDPAAVLGLKERHCRICRALNSLPDIQGRRVEAHYILGKSQTKIAEDEGVTKGSVSISITRGLAAMKKYINKPDCQSNPCTKNLVEYER
jgi:RNA polymerase sigma-70 factor (ECF subfamily)